MWLLQGSVPTNANSFREQRRLMVEAEFMTPGHEITNKRVLATMDSVPQHEFVPEHLHSRTYENVPMTSKAEER